MLTALLPLIALAQGHADPTPMRVDRPEAAQAMLADALGTAESVDFVRAAPGTVTFGIDRAGEAYQLIATIDATGVVTSLEIDDVGLAGREPGKMSWLVDVMKDQAAVTRLVVAPDGTVVVVTSEGQMYETYETVPGKRASDRTNAAVEARWAAAWDEG